MANPGPSNEADRRWLDEGGYPLVEAGDVGTYGCWSEWEMSTMVSALTHVVSGGRTETADMVSSGSVSSGSWSGGAVGRLKRSRAEEGGDRDESRFVMYQGGLVQSSSAAATGDLRKSKTLFPFVALFNVLTLNYRFHHKFLLLS